MAPERFSDHQVTYRFDIYSLACVLGECLTGAPPFRADSIEQLVAAHLMEPAPRPSQLRPGQVPAALDQVIAQGHRQGSPRIVTAVPANWPTPRCTRWTVSEQHQAESILQHGEDAAAAEHYGSSRRGRHG